MKTEILQHDIKWWVSSKTVKELDTASIDHIYKSIEDGYSSGELHIQTKKGQTSGWWEIVNWQDIANELYGQLLRHHKKPAIQSVKKALKRLDKNWN